MALREQWATSQEGEVPWKRHARNAELVDTVLNKPSDAINPYASVEVFYEGLVVLSGNLWVLNTHNNYFLPENLTSSSVSHASAWKKSRTRTKVT